MVILNENIPLPYITKSVTISPEIALKYPNGYFKEKPCKFCNKNFQPEIGRAHV